MVWRQPIFWEDSGRQRSAFKLFTHNHLVADNMARDLGSMAQAKLEEWAAQVLITANPSTKDKEGWDYILQLPYSSYNLEIPLDLRPSRIECWIQVKGIGAKRNRESISLSNWQKFVDSPLPAFFLIIDYGKEDIPQNAFLVHVDERWMVKVLKRLREVPKNKKRQLNKLTLDLTWSEEDSLDTLDGKGLEACIRKHIGDDFSSYIGQKQKIRKEVGQDASFSIYVSSTPYSNPEALMTDWVDFAIGVRESLPVAKCIILYLWVLRSIDIIG